jgi:hypothetical protein
MADFTDCELEDLKVGLPVQMAFKKQGRRTRIAGSSTTSGKRFPYPGAAKR